ncbi:transglycosylase domain-containing protein [Microlunatus parietis]|uniref:Membrane peptidoglycan carboxypeptidase n=1 Tax=Microlunatus parietis TaxID=682979 RepID=A0A7Y9I7U8_9ACTN|nr:transglycosylase domain-containing protein [Microlunatus parietis]NYE71665.1 membrane peptidoglycan carboxypeptidase [Microlunatus parietis]
MPVSLKRPAKVLSSLAMFLVVSVLAGVLVAGLFVPFAGLAGVTGQAAAGELENLPAELETPPQAERSKVLLGNGEVLTYFYDENRIYVPLDKIAPVMVQAQLAIEDHRFYEHGAMDLIGTLRAFVRTSSGDTQGGSTLTQQYVKMVLVESCELDQACIARMIQSSGIEGYQRKIKELRYALALEEKLDKNQILERYLNIAYYGQGAYGVEAAARHYFNTTAAKLTLPQAAMLAGLVQNPNQVNPVTNPGAAHDRRDVVINKMAEYGMITPAQVKEAKATKFDEKNVQKTRNGCVGSRYPFICDYVRRTLLQAPSLGKTPEEREDALKRGGLTIETAIDPDVQDMAQKRLSKVVSPTDPIISTMNMIQPGTGLILAMAQSRPVMGDNAKKGETYYNYSASPTLGGAEGYQAGSTFKAFTAAAALEKGIPTNKKYDAKKTINLKGRSFQTCEGRAKLDNWKVSNSTGANGVMDMHRAMQMSVNTYFAQLVLQVGLCRTTEMAEKLGIESTGRDEREGHEGETRDLVDYYQYIPAFTLGSVEISPISMAEAYATFAARGIHCDPIIIRKITKPDGKEIQAPSANCKRVLEKDVADGVNSLLSGVINKGTGRRAAVDDGRPQAGKTGTIDSNEAVWFSGYTPEAAGVAMIAIDKRQKPFIRGKKGFRSRGVKGFKLESGESLEGSGSGDAGQEIWKPTMERYLKDKPKTKFKKPSKEIETGKMVPMPGLAGLTIAEATTKLEDAGFTVVRDRVYSDTVPAGDFIGFSQYGGKVREFSTIYILFSAGRDPAKVRAEREAEEKAEREAEERRRREEERKKRQEQEQEEQKQDEEKKEDDKKPGDNKKPTEQTQKQEEGDG